MFKRITTTLLLTAALGLATATAGEMTLLEEAAEFERLDARVSAAGAGELRLSACDECEEMRLKIAPDTRLEINGERFPLTALNRGSLRDGVVFYHAGERRVTRIIASE